MAKTGQFNLGLRDSKKNWFNAAKVQDLVAALTRRAFVRIGAFIRKDAQKTLVYRSYSSSPGEAPHSHIGLLRNLIFFHYEELSGQLVVGPLSVQADSPALSQDVPMGAVTGAGVLEYGGVVRMADTGKEVRIAARPYMRPALKRAIAYPKLREAWAEIG